MLQTKGIPIEFVVFYVEYYTLREKGTRLCWKNNPLSKRRKKNVTKANCDAF